MCLAAVRFTLPYKSLCASSHMTYNLDAGTLQSLTHRAHAIQDCLLLSVPLPSEAALSEMHS